MPDLNFVARRNRRTQGEDDAYDDQKTQFAQQMFAERFRRGTAAADAMDKRQDQQFGAARITRRPTHGVTY